MDRRRLTDSELVPSMQQMPATIAVVISLIFIDWIQIDFAKVRFIYNLDVLKYFPTFLWILFFTCQLNVRRSSIVSFDTLRIFLRVARYRSNILHNVKYKRGKENEFKYINRYIVVPTLKKKKKDKKIIGWDCIKLNCAQYYNFCMW